MMDVTDLDRYAEFAFSSQISVEGSDINYMCRQIHFQKSIITNTQQSEVEELNLFDWTVTTLLNSQRGFWEKRIVDRDT